MVELFSKEGFVFTKNKKNNYNLIFEIENNNINLSHIIDFNFIKLICDSNRNIYEELNLKIINKNEATIYVLMKNLFEELGFAQPYLYMHITKKTNQNTIFFEGKTINSVELNDIPTNSELMPIQIIECNCDILSQQKIKLTFNILLHEHVYILPLVEKMTITILYKIFNRVKQFIENFTI